jgi:ribosomal protein S6
MTRNEAAIVGAYTGFLLGSFSDMYVEKIMGRPVFTHEMGNAAIAKEIQDKAKADYISIEVA